MASFATCLACGAAIEFVPSAKDPAKSLVLDAAPSRHGNVVIEHGAGVVLRGSDPRWFSLPADERRVSHFATCAAPERFRR